MQHIAGNTQPTFDKENGYLALSDQTGTPRLVYSAPLVRYPNNHWKTLPLEWDVTTSSLSITLPDLSFPLVIAFGLGSKLPDARAEITFDLRRFLRGKDTSPSSDDSGSDDKTKKKAKQREAEKPASELVRALH